MNNAVLVAATHKRLEKAFDGIITQVVAWIINKWIARINEMSIYNVRDPPKMGDREIYRENTIVTRIKIVSKSKRTIFKNHSPQTSPRNDFFA